MAEAENIIVKVEIVKGSKRKQEMVSIYTHDRSLNVEKPLDQVTQDLLGSNFKAYFKAHYKNESLILLHETTWTEWNKGRFH